MSSRRIAFRLWDSREQCYTDGPYFAVSLLGTVMLGAHTSVHQERYQIEQCTGRQDKTGKDIYEGDILLWRGARLHVTFSQEHGAWIARLPQDEVEEPRWFSDLDIYAEVIGTIHFIRSDV